MQLITIKDAYVTPTKAIGYEKPIDLKGCIYDAAKKKVCLSERFSGHKGDFYNNKNPQKLSKKYWRISKKIPGKSVYLGHLMNHYGHFITETISTFWLLLEKNDFDHYIFQSFEGSSSIPQYALPILEAFNIPLAKVLVVNTPLRLEEVTIPERLIKLNFEIKPEMLEIYTYLKNKFLMTNFQEKKGHESIYLSRVKNSKTKNNRTILNEASIEEYFKKLNFKIVYLEELSFKQQLMLLNSAKIIVGFSGSALHNSVFTDQQTKIIELLDIRSNKHPHPMQILCNQLSEVQSVYIPFNGLTLNKSLSIGFVNLHSLKTEFKLLTNLYSNSKNSFSTEVKLFIKTSKLTLKSLAVISKKYLYRHLKKVTSAS